MPPPKLKMHKTSGKARPGPPKLSQANQNITEQQPSTSSSSSSNNPVISLSAEQEQQFQTELYWCVNQLQAALSTDRLTAKQIQEHTKALNTLMSNSAPMVKKRQVMRLSFGDYRTKMLEDEKKAKKISIKVGAGKPSDKSVFLRKALINATGNDFKFNFPSPEKNGFEEQQNTEENVMETETTPIIAPANVFSKSDNSFRFNFSNDDQQNGKGS